MLRFSTWVFLLGVGLITTVTHATPPSPTAVRLMTFNLRYASEQSPNAWSVRRPVMKTLLAHAAPDIMGTQEGLYAQIQDIDQDLPDHDWIGLGRKGGSQDEFCAIFYRRDRFKPVEFDHFWLSDTPTTIGSMTWGNRWVRMATWVRFRELTTQQEFIVLNTHFDHQVESARQKSAALISQRIAGFDPSLPLIVMGDFNCAALTSPAFHTLTEHTGLGDTWTSAEHRPSSPIPNTFHGYAPPLLDGERIDWILTRGVNRVLAAAIITDSVDNQYPSDHFPVVADVQL